MSYAITITQRQASSVEWDSPSLVDAGPVAAGDHIPFFSRPGSGTHNLGDRVLRAQPVNCEG
ncbi:MAG TPA: hypothetical protein VFS38_00545 [Actinomycetota bacterium]|nr:hypothetical protein [Actinomycetota bacterium]